MMADSHPAIPRPLLEQDSRMIPSNIDEQNLFRATATFGRAIRGGDTVSEAIDLVEDEFLERTGRRIPSTVVSQLLHSLPVSAVEDSDDGQDILSEDEDVGERRSGSFPYPPQQNSIPADNGRARTHASQQPGRSSEGPTNHVLHRRQPEIAAHDAVETFHFTTTHGLVVCRCIGPGHRSMERVQHAIIRQSCSQFFRQYTTAMTCTQEQWEDLVSMTETLSAPVGSYTHFHTIAEEHFQELCAQGVSADDALRDVLELLHESAGGSLSAYSASQILQTLRPSALDNYEELWDALSGNRSHAQQRPGEAITTVLEQIATSSVSGTRSSHQRQPTSGRPNQQQRSSRGAALQSNMTSPASQHASSASARPRRLTTDFASLRRTYESSEEEDDEIEDTAEAACLQLVLDVIPDVAVDHVLSLINARIIHQTTVRLHSGQIIQELLQADSYPLDPAVEDRRTQLKTEESRQPKGVSTTPPHYSPRSSNQELRTPSPAHIPVLDQGAHLQSVYTSPAQGSWRESPVDSTTSHGSPTEFVNCTPLHTTSSHSADSSSTNHSSTTTALVDDSTQSVGVSVADQGTHLSVVLTSPSQNPWRTSPTNSPSSNGSPQEGAQLSLLSPVCSTVQLPVLREQLNRVTSPTHNAWSPEKARQSSIVSSEVLSDPFTGPFPIRSTPFLRRLQEASSSSPATTPELIVTPTCSDDESDSEPLVLGPVRPLNTTGEALGVGRAAESSCSAGLAASSPKIPSLVRQPRGKSRVIDGRNVIDTPKTRRQRSRNDPRDESPSAQAVARQSERQTSIRRSFEYVNSNEVTYGGDVPADHENGSQWKGKVHSFAQDAGSPAGAHSSSSSVHHSVEFRSPVATVLRSPSSPVTPEEDARSEINYDVDPLASPGWGR